MHRQYLPRKTAPKKPIRFWGLLPWLVLAYLATGVYSVGPNERAVVRRCGRVLDQVQPPGLHFGFPYGIDRVDRLRVFEHKRVAVGMSLAERTLGRRIRVDRSDGAEAPEQQLPGGKGPAEPSAQPHEAECLTGDYNLLVVSAVVQYRIADPKAYLLATIDVPTLVRNAAASSLSATIASMTVDNVLTLERVAIQDRVRREAQAMLNRYGAGVEVTAVSLEGTSPPQEVAAAFRDVTAAREDAQRMVNEAHAYASRLLPQARGKAEQIVLRSEADAEQVLNTARGKAAHFKQMLGQLTGANRQVTIRRLVLETMERLLPKLRKLVIDSDENSPLDLGIIDGQPSASGSP